MNDPTHRNCSTILALFCTTTVLHSYIVKAATSYIFIQFFFYCIYAYFYNRFYLVYFPFLTLHLFLLDLRKTVKQLQLQKGGRPPLPICNQNTRLTAGWSNNSSQISFSHLYNHKLKILLCILHFSLLRDASLDQSCLQRTWTKEIKDVSVWCNLDIQVYVSHKRAL